MQIDFINQSYIENYAEFKSTTLKRAWDLIIMVVEGEYSISTEEKQKPIVLKKNDIMFIPKTR